MNEEWQNDKPKFGDFVLPVFLKEFLVVAYNPVLVSKLLNRAGHPMTGDNEALICVRKAAQHVDSNFSGALLGNIALVVDGKKYQELLSTPIPKYQEHITNLEFEKAEMALKLDNLLRELKETQEQTKILTQQLIAQGNALPKPVPDDDGYYKFDDFRDAVVRKFGRSHGWQAFYEQMTGVNHSRIQNSRTRGRIEAEFFDMIETIDVEKYKAPTNERWAEHELDQLAALSRKGKMDKECAEILSTRFGRVITVQSVAGTLHRLRKKGRV